jgi:HlyD family secretion protein
MRARPRTLLGCLVLIVGAAANCARPSPPDAYGNVEATAVVVGAEAAGRLVSFTPQEGDALAADAVVGTIDVVELGLQRDQLAAQRGASASRVNEVAQQIDVLQAQRDGATAGREAARAQVAALDAQREMARRTYDRTQRLAAQQAATAQQLDQAERDVRVLDEQIKAQEEQVKAQESQIKAHTQQIAATRAQQQTASAQLTSSAAQIAQVTERMRKARISNPIAGTVLTTYAKAGEFVQPGQPLYKVANLDSVDVRAYVTEPQLSQLKIGAVARVTVDVAGASRRSLPGTVTWISSEAEFTPTPIQTREERGDLVYALKIRVPNEGGILKIGMPADVQFDTAGPAR